MKQTETTEKEHSEFNRLFWAARNEQNRNKKKAAVDDPAHLAALAFAKARGWQWAEQLLEASRLDCVGEYDKALGLLQKLEPTAPEFWQGLYHFVTGTALNAKGEYDEAIKVFHKALDDPKFEKSGNAWNNLGLAFARNGEPDKAIEAYHKALDDPKFDSPGYAWNNLGNALVAKGKHDEAIKAYRKALDNPKYDAAADAWYNLGMALSDKGEHDEAIKAYRKALDDPKFHTPGNAWNNLGLAFASNGEPDKAIEAYHKALDDPKFDSPGYAWNNLGNALAAKGKHDEAIKAYRKALNDPKYKIPGNAWNNLGVAFRFKGDYDEAIKAYRKALDDPRYDTHAKAWTNLAQAYVDIGKHKQAEEAFGRSLSSPDPAGGDHERARFGLNLLKSKIAPDALSPDDRAMAATPAGSATTNEIEEKIIAAIRAAGDTQYEKYIEKRDSERDNTLSILRGWSSAVTLLEGSERRWRGGGYFLKWRGHGIVIDPGFDFLRNFHDAGYHGREISAVIISHNHPDHNSDLKHIDDLRYELWRRLKKAKGGLPPYILVWDRDTDGATQFGIETPEHRYTPVPLTNALQHPIDLFKEHPQKLPIRIQPFKVEHGNDVSHAMGMVVELLDKKGKPALRIGYTADTAYFSTLHKHLAHCDVLIAHISQPSIDELQDASKLKGLHLGYRGTARLLKECKPKLALIGEFWAGFTDLRISLVKGLSQHSGATTVLPAGLAMHLKLPSLDIECTECKKPIAFSAVKVAPPTDNFGSLAYLCPHCMIG